MFNWKMGIFWISGGVLLWLAWKNSALVFRFLARFYGGLAILFLIVMAIAIPHAIYDSGGWDNFVAIYIDKTMPKPGVVWVATEPVVELSTEEQAIVDETDYMYSKEKSNEEYLSYFEFVFSPDYDVPNNLNTGTVYVDITNFSGMPIKYIEMTCIAFSANQPHENPIGIFKDFLHPVVDHMGQIGMLYPGKTQTYSLNRHIITWIDWDNTIEGTVETIPPIDSITCVKMGIQLASS